MPLTYTIVFDIEKRLQKRHLNHLIQVEQSTTEGIVNREPDGWCASVLQQQDLFLALTATTQANTSQRISYRQVLEDSQSVHESVDWRFSSIDVSGFDMVPKPSGGAAATATAQQQRARSKSATNREYVKGHFMGYGVIRLYRDGDVDETEDDDEENNALYEDPDPAHGKTLSNSISDDTVCAILAVPSYLTPYDFMEFIGASARDSVSHIRMVRTAETNKYMALLKFRTPAAMHQFHAEYNGRLFNSMEAETCQVVYVSSVRFRADREDTHDVTIPYRLQDPFTVAPETAGSSSDAGSLDQNGPVPFDASSLRRMSQASSGHQPPTLPVLAPRNELPTCAVCLERMDSTITGLLTIPCQHTFHCQCLSKWQDGSCPVCRYSQRKNAARPQGSCAVCHLEEHLWICLVCGHVGCGRYDQAHAYDHYTATGHCYAMDIESQRVWDYVSDGYVHRLIQNEVDGKLVELPGPSGPRGGANEGGGMSSSVAADVATAAMKAADTSEKKLDDVGLQFTQMLSSQLESQRNYYELLLATAAENVSMSQERATAAEAENKELTTSRHQLEHEVVPRLTRDLEKSRARADKLQHLYEQSLKRCTEEKLMAEQTVAKLVRLEAAMAAREDDLAELKEQVRDLMFFHEAQAKLADAGTDVTEGQITVGQAPSKRKGKKKR